MKKFLGIQEVIANEEIISGVWKMIFYAPEIAAEARPGQFVNVRKDKSLVFLRRPFGIVAAKDGAVTIIYRVVGTGTEELTAMRAGDLLSVAGPLGDGVFSTAPGKTLLVGGGVGLAPLIFLADVLPDPVVLIGSKNEAETFWVRFFEHAAAEIYVTTDDGTAGIKGVAAAALSQIFEEHAIDRIAVCGPTAMMRTIAAAAAAANIPCEVSMEKRMACGIGACLGCTFAGKASGRRYKVCTDGPVFAAKEVF